MHRKAFMQEVLLPIAYVLGIIAVCSYFILNPGSKTAANALSFENVFKLIVQHIILVLSSSFIAIIVAVPLGIIVSRPRFRKYSGAVDAVMNLAQTIPAIAILAIFYVVFGLGFYTALFALVLKTVLPLYRNTVAGMLGVPADTLEAASGMGMKPRNVLFKVQLPIALPVIMSGLRVAMVICTSNAALAAYISAGGLGDLIITGIYVMRNSILLTGGISVALLALLIDNLIGTLEKHFVVK